MCSMNDDPTTYGNDDTTLYITPRCVLCGSASKVTLNTNAFLAWQHGKFVQDAFPAKTDDELELLITGTHPECWDKMFPEEEESDEDDEC